MAGRLSTGLFVNWEKRSGGDALVGGAISAEEIGNIWGSERKMGITTRRRGTKTQWDWV
jgi:hypothetical protein